MGILKKRLSILLRISISIVLLVFLFNHIDIDTKTLWQIIKKADVLLLCLAFFVFAVSYVLCVFRWEMLLKAAHIHLPFKRIIISYAGGVFFSLFMPSTIGGDMVRSVDMATHTKKPKEVLATVFLDRLSGYVGLVVVAIMAVVVGWRYVQDTTVLFVLSLITLLLILILLSVFNKFIYVKINTLLRPGHHLRQGKFHSLVRRIKEALKNLHYEVHIFRHNKKIIFENFFLSMVIQTVPPVTFYILALALGIKVNIIYFFVFLPVVGAITLLPISIGGLGIRDATTVFFFAKAGVSKDLAFAMSLLNFSFILTLSVLGGVIYVLTVHHRRLQHYKPPSV